MQGKRLMAGSAALYHRQIGEGSLGHGEAGNVEGLAGQDRLDRLGRLGHIGEAFGIVAAPVGDAAFALPHPSQ